MTDTAMLTQLNLMILSGLVFAAVAVHTNTGISDQNFVFSMQELYSIFKFMLAHYLAYSLMP